MGVLPRVLWIKGKPVMLLLHNAAYEHALEYPHRTPLRVLSC